jgi:hypothetical protein
MFRSPSVVLVCAATALALGACSSSCDNRSGCAYQRNDPTRAQASGIHGASIARRLPVLRREAGTRIEGLLVNRWGELWTELDGGRQIALSHDGTDVDQSDAVDELVSTDDPFPVHDVDPYAIDRAMRRIAKRDPDRPFVKATLTRDDVLYGGLRWEIMVGGGSSYSTYAAAPDGSSICRMVATSHGKATPVHRCPDFGHQPPGIPAG